MSLGLRVRNLEVRFDEFVAVKDLSFEVAPGASIGLVGESGSGKSTVLRAICGLNKVTRGLVELLADASNRRVATLGSKAFTRQVQMVFQDPYGSLHPRQTVDRLLGEPLEIHGIDSVQNRVHRALDEVGLSQSFRFRYPHQLSGGQRQRVAIARALILEPQILLLDEPTSALDASVQAEVLNLLDQLRKERSLSFVMVSHDLAVVTHLCDQLIVMQRGRVVESLSAQALASKQVNHEYTRQLMQAADGFVRTKELS